MNSKTTASVKAMDDGPNGNSRRLYVVMLSIQVPGVDKPFEHRIGEFNEGYESFAREFCRYINEKQDASVEVERSLREGGKEQK